MCLYDRRLFFAGFFVPGNPNDRLDFSAGSWEQHASIIAKPATLLFKALNSSPAPLKEADRPHLLVGPLMKALELQGKLQAGKVGSCFCVNCTVFMIGKERSSCKLRQVYSIDRLDVIIANSSTKLHC